MYRFLCNTLLLVGLLSMVVGGIVISQIIARDGWNSNHLEGAAVLFVGAGIFVAVILTKRKDSLSD